MNVGATPYTVRSFVELASLENRRGKDISRIDPEVARITRALSAARQRYLRRVNKDANDDSARTSLRDEYRSQRAELRRRRDEAIEAALRTALRAFEDAFSNGTFSFDLEVGPPVGGKPTYRIGSSLPVVYAAKEVSGRVRSISAIDSPSRNSVVRALHSALNKPYQHAVLKLDIEQFFESVDHSKLRNRVSDHSSLDRISAALVEQLLSEYEALAGVNAGLPRGVGISSHLADLYMGEFDAQIRAHPGVLFFARYVDDIIIVCEDTHAMTKIKKAALAALKDLRLEPNPKKTYDRIANNNGDYPAGETLEYLGYRFTRSGGRLAAGLTEKRKLRRIERLERAFQVWLATLPNARWPNHGHNGMLLDRVRYLAGNTRLQNSKSNVAIGLYFSNSALDANAPELKELDSILRAFCSQHGSKMPDRLKARLESVSFEAMFTERTFLRFDQKKVEKIMAIWGNL